MTLMYNLQSSGTSFSICISSAKRTVSIKVARRRNWHPQRSKPTALAASVSHNMGVLHGDIEKILYHPDAIAEVVKELGG